MKSARLQLLCWIEGGAIAPDRITRALEVTGVMPDRGRWRRFLDLLLLVLGALSLACAVVFFIAYNWDALGRFPQFALLQLLIIAAVLLYWRLGVDNPGAQVALLVAAILLGVLLAFYGQTYQTGVDSWQLFATWALLILPWALVGRFAPLWLLWLGLLNLAAALYYQTFFGILGVFFAAADDLAWLLFFLNTTAWCAWELLAPRFGWMSGRWPVRLIATASGVAMTMLVLRAIFDSDAAPAAAWTVYAAWLAALYLIYRRRLPDLFMLAGACMTIIVCITSLFADLILRDGVEAGSWLLLAAIVVIQAAVAAVWLRQVHAERAS